MFNCFGIEDNNCLGFASKLFVQSHLIEDFSCLSVCDHRCVILLSWLTHVQPETDLDWSNTFNLCLRNHAVVAHAEWELALSWSNNHGLPMKDVFLMAVYVYNFSICLHVKGTFTHMPVTHAVCSAAPPYNDRRLLLRLSLVKVWMLPLVFGTENSMSSFPSGLIWAQHTFALSVWLSEMSSGPENPQHHCIELMYSFLLE